MTGRAEGAASGRELRLRTVRAVLDLVRTCSLPWDEWDEDAIAPYTNGYSMWFIGKRENYSDNGDLMGTAPLGAEEILARIEAREARDATS